MKLVTKKMQENYQYYPYQDFPNRPVYGHAAPRAGAAYANESVYQAPPPQQQGQQQQVSGGIQTHHFEVSNEKATDGMVVFSVLKQFPSYWQGSAPKCPKWGALLDLEMSFEFCTKQSRKDENFQSNNMPGTVAMWGVYSWCPERVSSLQNKKDHHGGSSDPVELDISEHALQQSKCNSSLSDDSDCSYKVTTNSLPKEMYKDRFTILGESIQVGSRYIYKLHNVQIPVGQEENWAGGLDFQIIFAAQPHCEDCLYFTVSGDVTMQPAVITDPSFHPNEEGPIVATAKQIKSKQALIDLTLSQSVSLKNNFQLYGWHYTTGGGDGHAGVAKKSKPATLVAQAAGKKRRSAPFERERRRQRKERLRQRRKSRLLKRRSVMQKRGSTTRRRRSVMRVPPHTKAAMTKTLLLNGGKGVHPCRSSKKPLLPEKRKRSAQQGQRSTRRVQNATTRRRGTANKKRRHSRNGSRQKNAPRGTFDERYGSIDVS